MIRKCVCAMIGFVLCFSMTSSLLAASIPLNEYGTIDQVTGSPYVLISSNEKEQISMWNMTDTSKKWDASINGFIKETISLNSNKFIVLSINENKLEKKVFNKQGEALSAVKYPFKISNTNALLGWLPPSNQVPERIALLDKQIFKVYQSPWKTPIIQMDLSAFLSIGESIIDFSYSKYPYLTLNLQVDGINNSDYTVKVINLYRNTNINLGDYPIGVDIRTDDAFTYVNTFFAGGPQAANVFRPNLSEPQAMLTVYNNATGKISSQIKQNFVDDESSGWSTKVWGGYLYVKNKGDQTWSLYTLKGKKVAENQKGFNDPNYDFISFNSKTKTACFAVREDSTRTTSFKLVTLS
ncbi:hypothetical protein ABEW34_27885 [Paenibacillus algorifonticola]|uniref:hypothetical protein n=1 Tax=Paenibacillus algorifonticola TaxID=684063 RepID=UPI003D2DF46E